jgi:tryptophan synthase alpha chain
MNGISPIEQTFARLGSRKQAALMPYFPLGYPNRDECIAILEAIASSGADMIELGIPFSDPLADGPTIQHTSLVALENGITVGGCLEIVSTLRRREVRQPLLLMSYINPILAYGIENFASQAAAAGADGLIVPDLPPEEAAELQSACRLHNLALVFLLAPTSTPDRIALAASCSSGFLYLVSVTGVTGARQSLSDGLAGFIQRVRTITDIPLAVGFGITTPEQASTVAELADGIIIGSALIQSIASSSEPCQAAQDFIASIRAGITKTDPDAG